ncbi:flagellar hook assembly protein FlgD [Marinovum sp. KMM 9879]
MAIDPYALSGATTGTTGSSSAAGNALSQLSNDYQSFITLLTAQIQNQDPLEPMDSTAFVSQLATLTQVEQAVAQNANLEGIASQISSLSAMSGLGLIGRGVVVPSSEASLAGGESMLGYRLNNEAQLVTMDITDGSGTILRSLYGLPGSTGALHEVQWDGLDEQGQPLPDGTYGVQLTALDLDGNTVISQTYALSQVTGLTYDQGLAVLQLDTGESVMAGMIEEVR